jgi:hypothetical protein
MRHQGPLVTSAPSHPLGAVDKRTRDVYGWLVHELPRGESQDR